MGFRHLQDVVKLPRSILPAQLSDMVGVIQHWDLLKNRCSFPVMWWIQGVFTIHFYSKFAA
jgi:hypothetical protein